MFTEDRTASAVLISLLKQVNQELDQPMNHFRAGGFLIDDLAFLVSEF